MQLLSLCFLLVTSGFGLFFIWYFRLVFYSRRTHFLLFCEKEKSLVFCNYWVKSVSGRRPIAPEVGGTCYGEISPIQGFHRETGLCCNNRKSQVERAGMACTMKAEVEAIEAMCMRWLFYPTGNAFATGSSLKSNEDIQYFVLVWKELYLKHGDEGFPRDVVN